MDRDNHIEQTEIVNISTPLSTRLKKVASGDEKK